MTRIDFYVVADSGLDARPKVAVRLADKALGAGHRLFINACDEQQAMSLSDLLWSFKPASFLPHALLGTDDHAPIQIGWGQDPGEHNDVLINLSTSAPAFFSRFNRVAEVVTQDPAQLELMRNAWRFYRDRGYPLSKHDL
jgi:DNA polymerase-3 subunit chi